MTSGSTASSNTEGPASQDPPDQPEVTEASGTAESAPDEPDHDSGRRAFFFEFGKQAATAAAQVAGMAEVVSRTSSALAGELLGTDESATDARPTGFTRERTTTDPVVSTAPAAEDTFRSAYRLAGDELVILDQRRVPEALEDVTAKRGSDVAYYLRLGVARGGSIMAQLAAYGMALTAAERADQPAETRRLELRRTERALVEARPSSRLVVWSVARMSAIADGLGPVVTGAEVAQSLRDEADAVAREISAAEAAIATALAEQLPAPEGRPLTVLVHGDHGALAGGQLGAGFAALTRLRDEGRELRVFVAEGRPSMDGARLAAWELRQAGIEHRIVPDSAVAWLFDREVVDAALIRAEWIAANGDVGALVGARAIAQLAAAGADGGWATRVIVTAIGATVDEGTPDGAAIPVELRPAKDLSAYLAAVPVRSSDALVPAADVVPAAAVDVLVTEEGSRDAGATA